MDGKKAGKALVQACEYAGFDGKTVDIGKLSDVIAAQAIESGLLAIAAAIESHAAAVRSAAEAASPTLRRGQP